MCVVYKIRVGLGGEGRREGKGGGKEGREGGREGKGVKAGVSRCIIRGLLVFFPEGKMPSKA